MKLYGKEHRFTIKNYNDAEPKDVVRYGFVDAKDAWVIKPVYYLVKEFNENLALVTLSEPSKKSFTPMAFIDEYNIKVIEINTPDAPETLQNITEVRDYKDGFTAIRKGTLNENNKITNGKWAVINKRGKTVTDFEFEDAETAVIKNPDVLTQEIMLNGPDCVSWADANLFADLFEEEKLLLALDQYIDNTYLSNNINSSAAKKAKQVTKVYEKIKADKIRELRTQRNLNKPDFNDDFTI